MPATVTEAKVGTRKGSGTSGERLYIIKGATDEAAAYTALIGGAAATVNGMPIIPQDCEVEEVADGIWNGYAKYKVSDFTYQTPGSFHISFDISGVQSHITQSRNTVNKYSNSLFGGPRDFRGAMGVNEDGTIEGCDILIPALTFQLNFTFDESGINDAYIATLMNIVGTVNTDSFHEFAAGTLILTKVSGSKRDDKKWDVTYSFMVSPNETGLSVGGITGIAKKGWEYMWVYYETRTSTAGSGSSAVTYTHKVPHTVYVEEVYRKTAYSGLGI